MRKFFYRLLISVTALIIVAAVNGPANAAVPDQVLGQGTFHAQATESFTDTTIRASATDSTPGIGTDASGTLSVSDAPSNNVAVHFEAAAFCVNADANRAVVVGTVTRGPDGTVGRTILVRVTDGGNEKDAPPDTAAFALSTLSPVEALAAGFCETNFADQFTINSGQFIVRNGS
ncbi:hypothetical protein LJR078_001757 [Arthrobacter sp. LjRoot78]|uniref:hypothetical protein n=1 Tax=Arthrobacter sp. LjRoot78 TaxID=3342338 RepID=UPI003ECFF783